jgi:hypothetical protein
MQPANVKRGRPRKKAKQRPSLLKPMLLVAISGLVLLAGLYFFGIGGSPFSQPPGLANGSAVVVAAKVDLQRLVGDWVRPDGGYVISVRRVASDGRVEAVYLNPRPIPVSRAEASADGDKARLFIELRGAGYPGSTYELLHDPRGDFLSGVYFQAALGQRFDVVFLRKK